jgi:hypothetical protein
MYIIYSITANNNMNIGAGAETRAANIDDGKWGRINAEAVNSMC